MVVMTKKMKNFEVVFSDPSKTYSSGDKVAGRVLVEVAEVTKVTAVRVIGIGCAKVEYAKGKQRCREDVDYLRYEDTVTLDDQPAGKKLKSNRCTE
ncbi:TXNIP protein, partial [Polyodon spathula]|nr:TXNIP protein [Polyodon spathula]